jgi:hypothetical protein
LVVLGVITGVEPGREYGRVGIDRVYTAVASLRITAVVSSGMDESHREGDVVKIDFFLGANPDVGAFGESIRGGSGLWFLLDKALEAERLGLEGDLVEQERGLFMLSSSQGLVIESVGEAALPLAERSFDNTALFDAIEGRSLQEVVAHVRQIPRPE